MKNKTNKITLDKRLKAAIIALMDDFLEARAKVAQTIKRLETELSHWRAQLAIFNHVETLMRTLSKDGKIEMDPGKQLAELLVNPAVNEIQKRGQLKRRVLAAVLGKGGESVSSTEVERALLQSGYVPTGKHFDISVFQTLNRLAGDGMIKRHKDGAQVYFAGKTAKISGTGAGVGNASH